MWLLAIGLMFSASHWSNAAPLHVHEADIPPAFALDFMKQYGYLDPGSQLSESLYTSAAMVEVVKQVQRFGALNQTGHLDNATLQLMKSPRCGVPDIHNKHKNISRSKRFILGSQGWNKRHITYFVANWSPQIGEEAVIQELQRAFNMWAGYARLNFSLVADPNADIIVAFGRGPHGDPFPFDGPGNTLAHAYFPYEMGPYGGDVHFDEDENWKINPGTFDIGVDFFTVAVHELGHSLGLAHSDVPSSIMFPYYKGNQGPFHLDYDDILGMYELYISRKLEGDNEVDLESVPSGRGDTDEPDFGHQPDEPRTSGEDSERGGPPRREPEHTTPRSDGNWPQYPWIPTSTDITVTFEDDYETVDDHREHERRPLKPDVRPFANDPCWGSFDAISMLRGELFFFRSELLWRMSHRGMVLPGYPVPFKQMFWRFPESITKIDAVYQRETDSNIILFTGNKYWVYNGDTFTEGSPRPLSALGLPQNLTHLDAAMVWGKNGKTFFFSGDQYWRFNETTQKMDFGYPKNVSKWRGVPKHMDAAMTWTDGLTYFFKGTSFWRFDNMLIKTDEQYPLPTGQVWFGCPV